MSISVSQNRKPSIIRKNRHFPDYQWIQNQINKKGTYAIQLLINSNLLLLPAAKRVELINFSGQKRSFGQALCKSHRSLPHGNPAALLDNLDNREFFF